MYSNILSTGDIHDTLFELCEIHARMHVFMCMYVCQCVYMCTPVFLREVCRACMSGNKCENEGGGPPPRGGGPCKRNMSESIKVSIEEVSFLFLPSSEHLLRSGGRRGEYSIKFIDHTKQEEGNIYQHAHISVHD